MPTRRVPVDVKAENEGKMVLSPEDSARSIPTAVI